MVEVWRTQAREFYVKVLGSAVCLALIVVGCWDLAASCLEGNWEVTGVLEFQLRFWCG